MILNESLCPFKSITTFNTHEAAKGVRRKSRANEKWCIKSIRSNFAPETTPESKGSFPTSIKIDFRRPRLRVVAAYMHTLDTASIAHAIRHRLLCYLRRRYQTREGGYRRAKYFIPIPCTFSERSTSCWARSCVASLAEDHYVLTLLHNIACSL